MPSTSDNRLHIHNHIIFNSTTLDGEKKFRDSWFIALGLQKLSDIICLEHGLSVIIPKKPSERDKNRGYHRLSFREMIREKIDTILEKNPKSYDAFLQMLRDEGYEIKNGKHTAIRGEGQQRFIRIDSLGDEYTEAELISQIEGDEPQEKKSDRPQQKKKRDFEYLIDIQENQELFLNPLIPADSIEK